MPYKDPEKRKAARSRWAQTKGKIYWSKRYQTNKEAKRAYDKKRYEEQTREKTVLRSRQWRKDNPEKHRICNMRHRARKANASGTCSTKQLEWRVEMFGGKCWVPGCGKLYEAIDHVIPLSRGGSNWPANLRPICHSHNSQKRDRHWRELCSD